MQANKVSPSFSNFLPLVCTGVAVGVATCGIAAHIFKSPNSTHKIGQLRSGFGNLGTPRFRSGAYQERMTTREASEILRTSQHSCGQKSKKVMCLWSNKILRAGQQKSRL